MSVRVRIAPSPTGDPHVGTAYIALLNYCFARSHGGRFVLRIEDTDQGRCSPDSERAIIESLHWLGLDYDEGPDRPGEHGPYRQSERVATGCYRAAAEQLVTQGDAYPCFCSADRLQQVRQEQIASKATVIGYDRHCRDIDPAEAQARIAAGEAHVIRMATPRDGTFSYRERLRKQPIEKQWAELDDQVLVKSDGWPTYHLAAVVDDQAMAISHVIRAEEWLNSLPKHIWLNERLGYQAPEYIHVGLLRNADKSKISKRKNPTNLLWYRQQGYLAEALRNFLALLGHSHPDGIDRFDLDELVRIFSIDRCSAVGPVFDLQKLDHLQGLYLRDRDDDGLKAAIHDALDQRLDELLPLIRERMTFGGDITWLTDFIFTPEVRPQVDDLVPKGWDKDQTRTALQATLKACKKAAKRGDFRWQSDAIEAIVRELAQQHEWKPRQYFMTLRVAIAGRPTSPPLFESMQAVGQLKCLARLEAALQLCR